jgi:hypothetical protein
MNTRGNRGFQREVVGRHAVVQQLATREVAVRSVLLQVFNLLIPPSALFRREILLRVIREAIKPARPETQAPRAKRPVLRYGRETS